MTAFVVVLNGLELTLILTALVAGPYLWCIGKLLRWFDRWANAKLDRRMQREINRLSSRSDKQAKTFR